MFGVFDDFRGRRRIRELEREAGELAECADVAVQTLGEEECFAVRLRSLAVEALRALDECGWERSVHRRRFEGCLREAVALRRDRELEERPGDWREELL